MCRCPKKLIKFVNNLSDRSFKKCFVYVIYHYYERYGNHLSLYVNKSTFVNSIENSSSTIPTIIITFCLDFILLMSQVVFMVVLRESIPHFVSHGLCETRTLCEQQVSTLCDTTLYSDKNGRCFVMMWEGGRECEVASRAGMGLIRYLCTYLKHIRYENAYIRQDAYIQIVLGQRESV